MSGLEQTESAAVCKRCGHLHWVNEGRCSACYDRRFMAGMATAVIALYSALFFVFGLLFATSCRGSVVTDPFLDAIAWTESRNNPRAVGRAGELGAYQLKAIAVRDVNNEFGWRCRHRDAVDPAKGRALARGYCQILERRLGVALRRQPSASEVYAAYRYGVRGWLRRSGR